MLPKPESIQFDESTSTLTLIVTEGRLCFFSMLAVDHDFAEIPCANHFVIHGKVLKALRASCTAIAKNKILLWSEEEKFVGSELCTNMSKRDKTINLR